MMTRLDASKRLITILAVVMVFALVACAGTSDEGTSGGGDGGDDAGPCDHCDAQCQGADNYDECMKLCKLDCEL
jgi:hypothetical protein